MNESRTLSRDYKDVKRHATGGLAFSGWVGLVAGLAIGLAVALGVFVHDRNLAPAEPQAAVTKAPASAQETEDFTYPEILQKGGQVPVRDDESGANALARPPGAVILEAGSFKQPAEAEKLQAKLALNGVDAKIQRFTLEDETWYRVRIGPIATVGELQTIRARLSEAEVDAEPVTPGGSDTLR
jgi:cell division septation protein DedD